MTRRWHRALCCALCACSSAAASVGHAQPAPASPPEPTEAPIEGGAGEGAEGAAEPARSKPDWGTSHELDTISPWSPSEEKRWGESDETVSPWGHDPAASPEDVRARFDVRLGDGKRRRTRDPSVRHGMFDRPYLARVGSHDSAVAIGGYFDVLGSYLVEDGVTDGMEFEARRFNLFVTSKIADRVRLTSELEFEHGTESITLETALVDILFHHAFNVRGGILLTPIGKFNIAHDAPIYDVIDRPLVSTEIIPATLSEVGFGIFGAFHPGAGQQLTYELYVVNGLREGLIAAEGTRIAAGKPDNFEGDNNGSPAIAGRIAFVAPARRAIAGELGFSGYAGVYNRQQIEGEEVDDERWVRIMALDGELEAGPMTLRAEMAYAHVDLPPSLPEIHAANQFGFYAESTFRFYDDSLWAFERASFGVVARADYIDLNLDERAVTREAMGSETTRLTVGPWFRPAPGTTLRVVYRHDWLTDELQNPHRAGGIQFGIATYF